MKHFCKRCGSSVLVNGECSTPESHVAPIKPITLQCKDIPDKPILEFLVMHSGRWCNLYFGDERDVRLAMPMKLETPDNLVLAKLRRLMRRGLITGCGCGCRGDFEITKKGREYLYSGRIGLHKRLDFSPGSHYEFRSGDPVYEIFTDDGKLFVRKSTVWYVCIGTGRIATDLEPFQGIKPSTFGQFTQTYSDRSIRGNHLHMYHTFTNETMLERDIELFKSRYFRRTHKELLHVTVYQV